MVQFSVNPQRFDPCKNFKFRVKWDGRYVAGINEISALKWATDVVGHREDGGDPSSVRKPPGPTKYEPLTLERGVHPRPRVRGVVAQKAWNLGAGLRRRGSLKGFKDRGKQGGGPDVKSLHAGPAMDRSPPERCSRIAVQTFRVIGAPARPFWSPEGKAPTCR